MIRNTPANNLKPIHAGNNSFILPKSFVLKWDLSYNSPYKTAQSKRDAFWGVET